MVRIVFSKVAVLDLKDIVAYIKRGSVKYAIAERKKIEQAIDKLSDYPLLGRIVPEVNDEKLREMIFGNYRIIYYLVSEKRIDILTIHHHARSLSNNPAFKEDHE